MNVFGKEYPVPRTLAECEKLKEEMQRYLLSLPREQAQALASSVGDGQGMRIAVRRPLR